MDNTSGRLLLRVTEAAQALGLGRSYIYELIAEGALPTVRFGRAVRIPRADLEAWIESRTERAGAGHG